MYGIEKQKHLGGYWNASTVWGDPGTWGPEIWNKIIKDYSIKSVADIGCGRGFSCKYFSQKGLDVIGIEGGENAIKNTVFHGIIIQNDYTISSALTDQKFDLIWCCEFVEHVEEKFSDNFLKDFKSGKYLAMTYAEPGQDGYHHVNCQKKEYWIKKIESLGFKFKESYSLELQEIAKKFNRSNVFPHSGHLERILFFENETI